MFACVLSHVRLFTTPWAVAHGILLSMEFYRQEYRFCCSVTQSCRTLCDPMDYSVPGFPVLDSTPYSLLKFTSTESVMPSTISSCYLLLPLPSVFPSIRVFLMSRLFTSGGQRIGASASASFLPMNIQDWFPLGLTSLISLKFKGLSRVFSNTTVQKHQFFGVESSWWSTLICIHDYWKKS